MSWLNKVISDNKAYKNRSKRRKLNDTSRLHLQEEDFTNETTEEMSEEDALMLRAYQEQNDTKISSNPFLNILGVVNLTRQQERNNSAIIGAIKKEA